MPPTPNLLQRLIAILQRLAEPLRPIARPAFRALAFLEAISWGALLVAMFFKWVVQDDPHAGIEGGVPVAGMVHGVVFVLYCASAALAWIVFRWSAKTGLLALAAAIPPFFTVWFEVVADRRGLLGTPARTEVAARSTAS